MADVKISECTKIVPVDVSIPRSWRVLIGTFSEYFPCPTGALNKEKHSYVCILLTIIASEIELIDCVDK